MSERLNKEKEIIKRLELLESWAEEIQMWMSLLNKPEESQVSKRFKENKSSEILKEDSKSIQNEDVEVSRWSWFFYNWVSICLLLIIILIFTIAFAGLLMSYMLSNTSK